MEFPTFTPCSSEVTQEAEALLCLVGDQVEPSAHELVEAPAQALARVYEIASRMRGCGITYSIGAEGVRAVCQKIDCDFSEEFARS